MMQVQTLNTNDYWQIWFYVNTYNKVVGSGNEKYWVDCLKKDSTHKPCVMKFETSEFSAPRTSYIKFIFLPEVFNSYSEVQDAGTNADEVVRLGKGVFVRIYSTGYNTDYIWNGRITEVKKDRRMWEVRGVSEFDYRLQGVSLEGYTPYGMWGINEAAESYTEDGHTHYKCDFGSLLKHIIKKKMWEDPVGGSNPLIYTQYGDVSFDKFNGCGLHRGDVHFKTAFPPFPPNAPLGYKSVASLIDYMFTKRTFKVFQAGEYTTDTEYGYIPYSVPTARRIMGNIINPQNPLTSANFAQLPKWNTFTPTIINSITIQYKKERAYKDIAYGASGTVKYASFGYPSNYTPQDWNTSYIIQDITTQNGSQTLENALYPVPSGADGYYQFIGIILEGFKIRGTPSRALNFIIEVNHVVDTLASVYCGGFQDSVSEYPTGNNYDVERNLGNTLIEFEPIKVHKDAVNVRLHIRTSDRGTEDTGGKWFVKLIHNETTNPYEPGEACWVDYNNVEHYDSPPYTDLAARLLFGEKTDSLYTTRNDASIQKYGIKTLYIRNPLNVSTINVQNFANKLLEYSNSVGGEEVVMGGSVTLKRQWLYYPYNIGSGVKIYDRVNKIGTELNPAIFVLDGTTFSFPECLFTLHLSKVPRGEEYYLFDKLKNVQEDLVQNL